jgi:hypothetical protein
VTYPCYRALQILQNSRKFLKIYNEDKTEVYHLAIIDYFTKWNLRKIAAQNLKGISNDKVCFSFFQLFSRVVCPPQTQKVTQKGIFLNNLKNQDLWLPFQVFFNKIFLYF